MRYVELNKCNCMVTNSCKIWKYESSYFFLVVSQINVKLYWDVEASIVMYLIINFSRKTVSKYVW